MVLSTKFCFDTPEHEIATLLNSLYKKCTAASLIAGFMTVEGFRALSEVIEAQPAKLAAVVVGAGTWRAFEAFDKLLDAGVKPPSIRVHLGYSRPTTAGASNAFYRYHPMLHSKVYLFELPDGRTAAFVGSHNLTGFALHGLNGEAGVLIEGPSGDAAFTDVRAHILATINGSVQYDPAYRDAYAWWAGQFMDGLAAKFNDLPRDGKSAPTIVIVAEAKERALPAADQIIYFELPSAVGQIQSLRSEVHVYLFDVLPPTPAEALTKLAEAKRSYWCKTIGVEDDRGGKELVANWYIDDLRNPKLHSATAKFRPTPGRNMQQVRIKTFKQIFGKFEYLFEKTAASFEPVFDNETSIRLPANREKEVEALKLIPPEHLPWFKVTALRREQEDKLESQPVDSYRAALELLSPKGGSYVMISPRRRDAAGS